MGADLTPFGIVGMSFAKGSKCRDLLNPDHYHGIYGMSTKRAIECQTTAGKKMIVFVLVSM